MTPLAPLTDWQNFYIIVGSAGAALTGLQFVVIAVIAGLPRRIRPRDSLDAFGTPTIVHFCAVLLMASIVAAPWTALSRAALALGACGAAGVGYVVVVAGRARRVTGYAPVLEDWLWHIVFPFFSYAALLIASIGLARVPGPRLFVIAAAALALLFIGIHNAWDAVTYVALEESKEGSGAESDVPASGPDRR